MMKKSLIICFMLLISGVAHADFTCGGTFSTGGGTAAAGGGGTWEYVNSSITDSSDNTGTLTGVTAGNLIVVVGYWVGSGNMTVSDGTDSFTILTKQADIADSSVQIGYLISSTASGTVTYTITFPVGANNYRVAALEFSHSETAEYDTSNGGYARSSTAVSSGNLTVADTDVLVVGACRDFTGVGAGSFLVNGAAAGGNVGTGEAWAWYLIVDSTFTGAATATLNSSGYWQASAASFKME